jgi:hypothetical protein
MINFSIRYTHPAQEPTGFEAYSAAKDKAGGVSAIEAVVAPTLFGGLESATLSFVWTVTIVVATNRIEADPARRRLFAFAG